MQNLEDTTDPFVEIIALIVTVSYIVVRSTTTYYLWNWFIPHATNFPEINFWQGIGIQLFVESLQDKSFRLKTKAIQKQLEESDLYVLFLYPLGLLVIGWFLHNL